MTTYPPPLVNVVCERVLFSNNLISSFPGLNAVQMEKLQLVPLMKVVKKTRTVKMVLLDAVLMEELGHRDQISKVALNVLRR